MHSIGNFISVDVSTLYIASAHQTNCFVWICMYQVSLKATAATAATISLISITNYCKQHYTAISYKHIINRNNNPYNRIFCNVFIIISNCNHMQINIIDVNIILYIKIANVYTEYVQFSFFSLSLFTLLFGKLFCWL